MKKLFALILVGLLIGLLICASAIAEDYLDLEPGIYQVGKDIETGKYDIRFNKLDKNITVSFSAELDENGIPDLTNEQSFSFAFNSSSNWWNIGGFTVTLYPGFLQIENSPCRMWIE